MNIDDKGLSKWKAAFAKDGVVYGTDEEYREAIHNFVGFVDMLIEIDRTHKSSDKLQNNSDEMYFLDKDGNKIIL